jgi:hypothetical protein
MFAMAEKTLVEINELIIAKLRKIIENSRPDLRGGILGKYGVSVAGAHYWDDFYYLHTMPVSIFLAICDAAGIEPLSLLRMALADDDAPKKTTAADSAQDESAVPI